MEAKLIKDSIDESGDSVLQGRPFIIPAGTIVNVVSDEGDYLIVELLDKSVSFPIEEGEYELQAGDLFVPDCVVVAKHTILPHHCWVGVEYGMEREQAPC